MKANLTHQPPAGAPASTIWFGGPVDEASVTLRFFGDDLDPQEITGLLGCDPSEAARTGQVITRSRGSSTVRRGFWKLRSERSTSDVADQIAALLARLTDDVMVWQALTARYDADLFSGLFLAASNRGIELSSDLLRLLADRHRTIGFDIYAPSATNEVA